MGTGHSRGARSPIPLRSPTTSATALAGPPWDGRAHSFCDEIHNLSLNTRSGAEVSDTLKYFSERIPAMFVYAGIDVAKAGLFSGVRGAQIAGRFTLITSSPFPRTSEWEALVATVEDSLRLHLHTAGTLTSLAGYLHQRTGGMIGSLSHLVRGAAVEAILNGSENITRTSLEAIDLDHAAQATSTDRTGRTA